MYKEFREAKVCQSGSGMDSEMKKEGLTVSVIKETAGLPDTSKSAGNKKDFKSAVIIMPPEELWDSIQKIRIQHDKGYKRWMPHINMLYPFIKDSMDDDTFQQASEKLSIGLQNIKPFGVKFSKESFSNFRHKKSCTFWLSPLPVLLDDQNNKIDGACASGPQEEADYKPVPHSRVIDIQRTLESLFPDCDDLGKISEAGFTPHLSLGQCQPKKVNPIIEDCKTEWQDIEFDVNCVYLISRKDFNDPFHIRYAVPFGGSKPKAMDYTYIADNPY